MSESNIIKSITLHVCPHCGEEILVESQMTSPTVNSLFTAKDVEAAKKDCIERVETLTLDEEKKASVIKWLNDPDTVFGPAEIESIILSLLKPENRQ